MDFIGGMLGFGNDPSAKLAEYEALEISPGQYESETKGIEAAKQAYEDAKKFLDSDYKQELSTLNQKKDSMQKQKDEQAELIINKVTALSALVKSASAEAKKHSDRELLEIKMNVAADINKLAAEILVQVNKDKVKVKQAIEDRGAKKFFGTFMPEEYTPFKKIYEEIEGCVKKAADVGSKLSKGKGTSEEYDQVLDEMLSVLSPIVLDGVEKLSQNNYTSLLRGFQSGNGLYKRLKEAMEAAKTGQIKGPDPNFDMSRFGSTSSLSSAATGGDGSVTFSYTFLIIAIVLVLIMLFLHFHLKRSRMPYTKVVEYC